MEEIFLKYSHFITITARKNSSSTRTKLQFEVVEIDDRKVKKKNLRTYSTCFKCKNKCNTSERAQEATNNFKKRYST